MTLLATTADNKPPTKDYRTFALEVSLREIQAVQEGKIDRHFLAYCERVIKRALAS